MTKYKKKMEDLQRDMEEKELEGRQKMDKIEQDTRDIEMKYEAEINRRREEHDRTLKAKEDDQKEKKAADDQRYKGLVEQKTKDLTKFETMMSEMYVEHEKLMENLNRDQAAERKEKEQQKKALSLEINQMVKSHKEERDRNENATWDKIEEIKERNKSELSKLVDNGMKMKGELTLIKNEYRSREQEQDNLRKKIKD